MANPTVQFETKAGSPVPAGGWMIIPVSRALQIKVPGLKGGFTWNRPVGLWVQSPDGSERFMPIQDVTRQAQVMMLGAGLVGSLLVWLLLRHKFSPRH